MANSSSRRGARVIWVCVHTAEGIRKASDLKAFFERSTNASSHAVADDSTLLDNLVPYDRASWTLRNGNSRSDNLELCGFAAWSRAEWINNHQGMLNNAAAWVRSRCLARGIPIVHLLPADVKAGRAGVIGHVDYTQGTGDGTHWDPGPGFPWDIVIARAAGGTSAANEENELNDEEKNRLKLIEQEVRTITRELTGDPQGDPLIGPDMKSLIADVGANVPGWDTPVGKKTAVAMLQAILVALKGNANSRIPGDTNATNVEDLVRDNAAWTFVQNDRLAALDAKLDALTAAVAKLGGTQ